MQQTRENFERFLICMKWVNDIFPTFFLHRDFRRETPNNKGTNILAVPRFKKAFRKSCLFDLFFSFWKTSFEQLN